MDDQEIRVLMWEYFGLETDLTWTRQRLLTELVKRATQVIDY